MLDVKVYKGVRKPTWCPGCGDYGILTAVKEGLVLAGVYPHQAFFISGIGCGSKLPDYIKANGYLGIHGRGLPLAMGVRLANPELHVLVTIGDGDCYGIGGNHFIHALRRNPNITLIVENNMVYGLTKGQYSPTSPQGLITSTTPDGAIEVAFNPLAMAIAGGGTFVARGFAGDTKHLAQLIAQGVQHNGFALIDVLQPCVIYDPMKHGRFDWYRERVYKLDETPGYDPSDRQVAWEKAHEWGERIPIGVLYQVEGVPTYEEQVPALAAGVRPVQVEAPKPEQWESLLAEFA